MPSLIALGTAGYIFAVALAHWLGLVPGASRYGVSWTVVAGFLTTCGHLGLIMAVATHFYGVRSGYRLLRPTFRRFGHWMTLETALLIGTALILVGGAGLVAVARHWSHIDYRALSNPLPLVLSSVIGAIGVQTILGGFMLAIIAGNDNRLAPEHAADLGAS